MLLAFAFDSRYTELVTRATCGSTSLGLGLVRRSFCVPKIAPTCFAHDFDVYMACEGPYKLSFRSTVSR